MYLLMELDVGTSDAGNFISYPHMNVGRRDRSKYGLDGSVWDGCLGHVMLFNKSLTSYEIEIWSKLIDLDFF
jgi:hypothetical protein